MQLFENKERLIQQPVTAIAIEIIKEKTEKQLWNIENNNWKKNNCMDTSSDELRKLHIERFKHVQKVEICREHQHMF